MDDLLFAQDEELCAEQDSEATNNDVPVPALENMYLWHDHNEDL